MPALSKPVLIANDLTVRFRTRDKSVTLVDKVSFEVPARSMTALVGESGAGKSITVRAILGLLGATQFEVTGSVTIDGNELDEIGWRARQAVISRSAAVIFQDPSSSLNPTMRVGRQIAEVFRLGPRRNTGISKVESRARALALMRDVGIAAPEKRFWSFPHQLSGGMRQRIAIAIAIAGDPKILFADEATTSLDVTTQQMIMKVLNRLCEDRGMALVLVTHDLALAAQYTQQIVVMYSGEIVEIYPTSNISEARMPYTQALLGSIPTLDGSRRLPDPIPGVPPDPARRPSGCSFHPRCGERLTVCSEQRPQLFEMSENHLVRCWARQKGLSYSALSPSFLSEPKSSEGF